MLDVGKIADQVTALRLEELIADTNIPRVCL